jgi:PAS domain S-box-containing protein
MNPAKPWMMSSKTRSLLSRYGSALAGVLLAALVRAWLRPVLGDQYPFPTFFIASMVTAWYAGFGPALLSLLLGCLTATYFFVPPENAWAPLRGPNLLASGLYLFVGLTNAILSESLRRARDSAEEAQQAVKDQAEQLRAANRETEAINAQIWSQRDALQRLNEQLQGEQQRLTFLAEASRVLAASLDYQATLTQLARLVVPRLADWCAVDIVGEDGALSRLAVAHVDPARVALAEELQRRYPEDPDAPHGVGPVLRTGCSQFVTEIPDSLLVGLAKDPEHLRILRSLGLRSYLCVPLTARDQTLGVLTFASAESGRRYGPADVEFAEDLARRAAVAIDNARLYGAAHEHEGALRREQELLQRIIDAIPVMIVMYEPDTQVLRLNPEFERLTGWTTEEARRIDLMAACYPDPEYRESVREYMLSLQPGWRDLRMTTKDGREIDTSWANLRLSDDTQIGIGIDISQRKWLEDELRRRVEALHETDRQKDQFIAVLAHELRNPLAPIRNAVELLKQAGPPEPRLRRAQAIIERQVLQQARLLDDLLDVSRISRGKIRLRREQLDLVALVRDAAEDNRSLLETAGLTLTLALPEAPLWVEGDATRLAQIVGNLLQNSAKFTDPAGSVTVALGVDPKGSPQSGGGAQRRPGTRCAPPPLRDENPVAVIRVRDTGIGIEPELLPHLFNSFTQADRSLERTRGGLGLGLALVKGLVELHGGEVKAASDGLGRGAEFTVRLPILDFGFRILDSSDEVKDTGAAEPPAHTANPKSKRPDPGTGPALRAPARNPKSIRLLIIEDNRDAADSLRELLELCGCEVAVAYSGPEGVRLARQLRPEAVLCDLGLPGMSGYEVAAQLRQDPDMARMRLIAVSGYGQGEDRRRARQAGFDLHLTKPVDPAALQQLLEIRLA